MKSILKIILLTISYLLLLGILIYSMIIADGLFKGEMILGFIIAVLVGSLVGISYSLLGKIIDEIRNIQK